MDKKHVNENKQINNLRAIAIIMVVFGHSIIIYQNEWTLYLTNWRVPILNIMKHWLDLIQMPLFFSLSGFLFCYTYEKTNFIKLIKKKFNRLIIPFFSFSLLWMIPIRILINYPGYRGKTILDIIWNGVILGTDCGHLWFLPCLFLNFLLTFLLFKILKRVALSENIKNLIFFVLIYIVAIYFYLIPVFPGSEVIRSVAMNWIWFGTGFLICYYNKMAIKIKNIGLYGIFLALIISGFLIFHILSYEFIGKIVLLISFYMFVPRNDNRVSRFLSTNSFGIYLFHSPLVYITYSLIPNVNPVVVVLINFLVFGCFAIILTVLLKKTKGKILLGE